MIEIPLRGGLVATIDDEDEHLVAGYRWGALVVSGEKYAVRYTRVNGKSVSVLMHRVLLGLTPHDGFQCDHIDGDGLNNRRANLRACVRRQNAKNRKVSSHSGTGVKGVYARGRRFQARITCDGVRISLGSFGTKGEAAQAYAAAAAKLHGEFACWTR